MKEFVKKKAVIVKDRLGLPNYMTMFYMEPGTYSPEDVPEMFKIRNNIVPAILISQYHNTTMKSMGGDVAVSRGCWYGRDTAIPAATPHNHT